MHLSRPNLAVREPSSCHFGRLRYHLSWHFWQLRVHLRKVCRHGFIKNDSSFPDSLNKTRHRAISRDAKAQYYFEKRPNDYYKAIWYAKDLHENIEIFAKFEHKSRKSFADKLGRQSIKDYMTSHIWNTTARWIKPASWDCPTLLEHLPLSWCAA